MLQDPVSDTVVFWPFVLVNHKRPVSTHVPYGCIFESSCHYYCNDPTGRGPISPRLAGPRPETKGSHPSTLRAALSPSVGRACPILRLAPDLLQQKINPLESLASNLGLGGGDGRLAVGVDEAAALLAVLELGAPAGADAGALAIVGAAALLAVVVSDAAARGELLALAVADAAGARDVGDGLAESEGGDCRIFVSTCCSSCLELEACTWPGR